ncbi:unnamed protein product [Effrenium voratum]|nr:unnamed protein product [Effrenium voratum]
MDASESRVVGPQGEVLFVRRNLLCCLGCLGSMKLSLWAAMSSTILLNRLRSTMEPALKRSRLIGPEPKNLEEPKNLATDITGLWAVCDPEDRCHLFRWRLAPDARCFEGVQLGVAAMRGNISSTGLVQWFTAGQRWQGQLDPTGWCIRGQHFNDAGEVLGSFGAMRQREPDPWEPAEEASDRSHMEFQDWADGLFFSLDREGKEQLLDADGQQVMMEWEKPYVEKCADELQIAPVCDVLEIGFGCGYSADRIQHFKPRSHTIIECSEVVLKRLKQWASTRPNVRIVEGTWQQRLPELGTFDRIFFDDYGQPGVSDREMFLNCPNEQYKAIYDESPTHFHAFLDIALQFHARPGTRISGYLVSPIVVDRDDVDITYESMGVQPPAHCNYYFRNEAVVPIFAKTADSQASDGSTRSPSLSGCEEQ